MRSSALLFYALSSSFALGCADFSRGNPSGNDTGPPPVNDRDGGSTEALSFASDVHALLVSRCQGCHGAGGSASTTAFVLSGEVSDDYAVSISFVSESAPAESRLVSKAAGTGHAGGALFPSGSDEQDLLVQWIAQGALP